MNGCRTPRHDRLTTPTQTPDSAVDGVQLPTPSSLKWDSPKPDTPVHPLALRTQKEVDASPTIKRLQQDLLILTSFNDNSSLQWRPSWFQEEYTPATMWTLHNPPNVVTEPLPNDCRGPQLYTRRMRRADDPAPLYIKGWEHWVRYCNIYGVPRDFLREEQVRLMRMGLPRATNGSIRMPPPYPLYPEPSPQGHYVLTPSVYSTHLPRKFEHVVFKDALMVRDKRSAHSMDDEESHSEYVVVKSDGKLSVTVQEECSLYPRASKGHRWSYLPWTTEMQKSCQPLTLKLRLWKEQHGIAGSDEVAIGEVNMDSGGGAT